MSVAVALAHEGREGSGGQPRHWELPDVAEQPYEFNGWLLGEESTEMASRARWTKMDVYKTVGGQYVLRVIGCSVLYHRSDSRKCNTGDVKPGREMDDDLEPCNVCRPPDYLRADMQEQLFNVEVDIPTITPCETAADLIYAMGQPNGRGGRQLSYLSGKLLRELRKRDGAINAELNKPRTIA